MLKWLWTRFSLGAPDSFLISSNLSCNLCLWYYDQLVHFDKQINANVYRHSLWECSKRFYSSFEWHLTPHMTLSIETCIRRTPWRSGHYSIPRVCPLNTGFTVNHSNNKERWSAGNLDDLLWKYCKSRYADLSCWDVHWNFWRMCNNEPHDLSNQKNPQYPAEIAE